MKILRYIFVGILAVVVQFAIILYFTLQPINAAKVPYRRAERAALIRTMIVDPSPANKAAYEHELHIATQYAINQQGKQTGIILLVILSFEGLLILARKHDETKPVA